MKCPKCGTEVDGKMSTGWVAAIVVLNLTILPIIGLLFIIPAKRAAKKCPVCGTKVVNEWVDYYKYRAPTSKAPSKMETDDEVIERLDGKKSKKKNKGDK